MAAARNPAELVTDDIHAEDRLHDAGVELHDAEHGVLACLDEPRFSVCVYARNDVAQGELHEGLNAAYLQLMLAADWQGGDE